MILHRSVTNAVSILRYGKFIHQSIVRIELTRIVQFQSKMSGVNSALLKEVRDFFLIYKIPIIRTPARKPFPSKLYRDNIVNICYSSHVWAMCFPYSYKHVVDISCV